MQKFITQTIVAGYGSGETNFLFQLDQSGLQVQQDFENEIIQPLVEVLNSADQTAVLTITGHSDRVDTEGLNREERRKQEWDASIDRANSADEAVRTILHSRLPGQLPVDLDEIGSIAIVSRASGAAYLKENGLSLSIEQRRQNRRVQFRVIRFIPD